MLSYELSKKRIAERSSHLLIFKMEAKRMKRIAVSSFKGGTAKTSTSLHIGAAFAKFHKKKVLLIDFDAQANLTTGLGLDPDAQDSLAPVLQGTKTIDEVILKTEIRISI